MSHSGGKVITACRTATLVYILAKLMSHTTACRTGILAIFAAKAGARQVYAVEATSMAKHAASLVKANGVRGLEQQLRRHVLLVDTALLL